MKHIGSTWAERRDNGHGRHPACAFEYTRPRRPWEHPPLVHPQRTYACRHPASFEHAGKLYCNAHAKIVALRMLIDGDLAKVQAFKDFVHGRLDEAGVPTHPDGQHSKEGCRIGDRLDIVLKVFQEAQTNG